MKTKKLAGVILAAATIFSLSSCGENVEENKSAVEKTAKMTVLSTSTGTALEPSVQATFEGSDYLALTATTKQQIKINNNIVTVGIDWTWDAKFNDYLVLYSLPNDDTHKKISINYPKEGDNVELSVTGHIKAGSQTQDLTFSFVITPSALIFDEMSIADLYKVNSTNDNFDFIGSDGNIKKNHEDVNSYYQVAVSGKVIYKSPDSNWGLLADGDKVVQLYQLGKSADNDMCVVGNYVKAYASIAQYYGNIQLSYVKMVRPLSDAEKSKIAEPKEITVTDKIGENPITKNSTYTWFSGIGNAISTVTGTLDSNVSKFKSSARFVFNIKLADGSLLEVAHDYHVCAGGSEAADAIGTDFTNFLSNCVQGETKITVHGTIRYSGNSVASGGKWTIIPMVIGDLSVAK